MNAGYRQSQAFFESRYQAAEDPWNFASSAYELARYDATLSALSNYVYGCAYEPGCSIGVLTHALAQRCVEVVASDISARAVERARHRCIRFDNVFIEQRDVEEMPGGSFDLIVFSELGYYFTADRLRMLARNLATSLQPGGEFVAVHWLGESEDHLLHGNVVHELLRESLPCTSTGSWVYPGFRIDSWRRPR